MGIVGGIGGLPQREDLAKARAAVGPDLCGTVADRRTREKENRFASVSEPRQGPPFLP